MNTRQKAKHFKRLYESTLSQTPYPVIHTPQPLTHYRSAHTTLTDQYTPEYLFPTQNHQPNNLSSQT